MRRLHRSRSRHRTERVIRNINPNGGGCRALHGSRDVVDLIAADIDRVVPHILRNLTVTTLARSGAETRCSRRTVVTASVIDDDIAAGMRR